MKTILAALSLAFLSSLPVQAADRHFRVEDIDGQVHDVTDLLNSGKRVAFVFWQTWCTSCKKEAPKAAASSDAFKDDVAFFGVVSGTDEYVDETKVRSFVDRYHLPYPQIRDRELKITEAFDVKGTPTVVVLGKGHRVLYRGHHLPDDLVVQ